MARERILLLFLIALMLIANVRASVMINEIMPNAGGCEKDCEWVELYSTETFDLNLWVLDTEKQNVTLNTSINDYIIITKNKTSFLERWMIDDAKVIEWRSIGLVNDGDNVTLYDNNLTLKDNTTYLSFDSGENKNKSWARTSDVGNWAVCPTPTPGTANNCSSEQNQTHNLSDPETPSSSTESSLAIVDAPSKAAFGETIDVEISAYRGDTAKYAIYLYIRKDEDIVSEKVSLHLDDKLKSYSFTVPLKIKPNCDAGYDEGSYAIILDGLDKLALKDITLKGNAECESEVPKRGKVSYKIDFPDDIEIGKEFIVSVEIYNNQNKRQQFSVWSYVYQNNNCYSCGNKTREANAEQAIIDEYESATLFLKNTVYNANEGVYDLKVKILIEGYETTKDFTFDIFVKSIPAQENKTSAESILNSEPLANESSGQSKITGEVVYKADKKSPLTTLLLFVVLCLLLLLYFMLKRKQPRAEGKGFEEEEEPDTKKQDEIDYPEEETDELKGDKTEKSFSGSETETESEKGENGA